MDGKRGRGRPRTTWLKNIVDWTGLAINDLHTYSMDRQKWKMTIDAVAHGAPTTATVTGYRGGGGGGCLRDDYTAVSFARPRTQIRLSPYYPQTEPRLQCKRWLSSGPYHAVHVLIPCQIHSDAELVKWITGVEWRKKDICVSSFLGWEKISAKIITKI